MILKENTLANERAAAAGVQLLTSYIFKLPRITQIRKYRAVYNNDVPKQLRVRYNIPIPFFAGMIDTLQAGLDDSLHLAFMEQDPADWKACRKVNAAVEQIEDSMNADDKWDEKFRMARQECAMTGRGILKYSPASGEGGYHARLDNVAFEDFYFESKGGYHLENHLFAGQTGIWRTKSEIEKEAGGIYDAGQVKKLVRGGTVYKQADYWNNYDFANRFRSLGQAPESANYVGEVVYNLAEFVHTYKGERWYIVFDTFSGTWIRFEKYKEVNSSGLLPWFSFASHPDQKNFSSKGFADDAYPIAKAATDLLNEDLENRRRMNSRARAFDPTMFKNVRQLDEAQAGRDRLVEVDTKNGTRKIAEGIYEFNTQQLSGTLDAVRLLEDMAGRNLGVSDLQKGAVQDASKKVGVVYSEMANISQRLSFAAKPIVEAGQELGLRFFGGLKDYMRDPIAIKMYGEDGYQYWDTLKRIDLNTREPFKISVVSKSEDNKNNMMEWEKKMNALNEASQLPQNPNPTVNQRLRAEYILRNGGWKPAEIALLLDPTTNADKTTIAETSAAIQDLMMGRVPPINYNATAFFMQRILDFVKTHQGDKVVAKNYQRFIDYIMRHKDIAAENEKRRAQKDTQMAQGEAPGGASLPPATPPSAAPGSAPPMQAPQPEMAASGQMPQVMPATP